MAIEGIRVPYLSLDTQWLEIRTEALELIDSVLTTGKYLEHEIVELVEFELAEKLDVRKVVLLNSGTDALMFALLALGVKRGDEVITVPNSFIASVAAIQHVGARPVMVDVGDDHLMNVDKIESAITPNTRAIMPVHLEGKVCDMESIQEIATLNNLFVIEDAAQAFGSKFNSSMAGSFSDIACFSLHPLKNLNACGDGGFIATDSLEMAKRIKALRNHGQIERNISSEFGFVSRFDSIQAAIVHLRLKRVDSVIEQRRMNANQYNSLFRGTEVLAPVVDSRSFHSYHTYTIEVDDRDALRERLIGQGIDTRIHYPRLIIEQKAFIDNFGKCNQNVANAIRQKNRILSIPIHPNLSKEQIVHVANSILAK
jgi:dTDP-4-amino-4,6-dideoxygalactose transaminase